MGPEELAKMISEVSHREATLLYYLPDELEKAIREDRGEAIVENGKFIGCSFWSDRGDGWVEVDTMYVVPEFRGMGYALKLMYLLKEKAQKRLVGKKALLFTQVPAIKSLVERLGFMPAKFSDLPAKLWFKIILHRLHPMRILSYIKYLPLLKFLSSLQLYILTPDTIIK